jgi:SAM-dependent methyltransferase
MNANVLLQEIDDYCRRARMAETTFGRRAVNDGKFTSRLRYGGRVTLETVQRVQEFIAAHPPPGAPPAAAPVRDPAGNFRFFDNRQKYLMFVNTCSEKWVIAQRVALELANLHPRPPAVRLFDAGVGDGTVLARVLRAMHSRFRWMPFSIVAKEISLEDVRLTLEKMPDRFYEHPATVLVMTNLNYAEAPWLTPASITAATGMVWHELALQGDSAADFDAQITGLAPFLAQNWRASVSRKTGNPVYEKPVVLVIYREDQRFLLHDALPRRGAGHADYDLVIASQPWRARASVEFKARRVLAPLARALAPGGRLIGIHSSGGDPGMEIVRQVWPDENPFTADRHMLLKATKAELGGRARQFNLNAYADSRSLFRYEMHTLPNEIDLAGGSIGTSTLFAAWNAATYVAQIEDERLAEAMGGTRYLEATRAVLREHKGLWFRDESFVISRKRDV